MSQVNTCLWARKFFQNVIALPCTTAVSPRYKRGSWPNQLVTYIRRRHIDDSSIAPRSCNNRARATHRIYRIHDVTTPQQWVWHSAFNICCRFNYTTSNGETVRRTYSSMISWPMAALFYRLCFSSTAPQYLLKPHIRWYIACASGSGQAPAQNWRHEWRHYVNKKWKPSWRINI